METARFVPPLSAVEEEVAATAIAVATPKSAARSDRNVAAAVNRHVGQSVDYQQRFAASQRRKPLYRNRNFDTEPWQLIARIADETVRGALLAVAKSVDLGEAAMVRSFIRMEMM